MFLRIDSMTADKSLSNDTSLMRCQPYLVLIAIMIVFFFANLFQYLQCRVTFKSAKHIDHIICFPVNFNLIFKILHRNKFHLKLFSNILKLTFFNEISRSLPLCRSTVKVLCYVERKQGSFHFYVLYLNFILV